LRKSLLSPPYTPPAREVPWPEFHPAGRPDRWTGSTSLFISGSVRLRPGMTLHNPTALATESSLSRPIIFLKPCGRRRRRRMLPAPSIMNMQLPDLHLPHGLKSAPHRS
jgi:hypothetical protein